MGILDYFTPEARRGNREWLDSQNAAISEALRYYLGPTGIPERLGLLAESTPTAGLERAGTESSRMFAPGLSGWDRMAAAGNMLSETAGAGAGLLGMPAAGRMADDLVEAAAPAVRRFGGDEFGGVPVPGSVRTQKVGNTTVQFSIADDGTAEIYSVRTPKDKRGGGSARSAMEAILPQLRDEGATSVKLVSSPLDAKTNPARLKGFYESLGFQGTGETANIAGDPIMRMDLPQRTDAAAQQGSEIINLLRSGRAGEVTEQMLDMGDPVLNARLSEYLYSNYDLPMDAASRMGRATEMGAIDEYHGTTTGGDMRYPSSRYGFGSRERSGFFTSDSPYMASTYADPLYGSVLPMMNATPPSGLSLLDAGGEIWSQIPGDTIVRRGADEFPVSSYAQGGADVGGVYSTNQIARGANLEGDGGVRFENLIDRGMHIPRLRDDPSLMIEFQSRASQPSTVTTRQDTRGMRSRFARFDPRLSHLRDLNAALAAGVPLGLLAMQPGQEPQ
jgi:GNAT superfamily N-acetyltransferase